MFTDFEQVREIVNDCYRKFKSHVYYSNNLQNVRLKIADFERDREEMSRRIDTLSDILIRQSRGSWDQLLTQVSYYVLPKISVTDTNNHQEGKEQVLTNCSSDIKIDKVNFFVDAPIEVYIIDTLWTVLVGKLLVEKRFFGREVCANVLNKIIYDSKEKNVIKSTDFKNLSIYNPASSVITGIRAT